MNRYFNTEGICEPRLHYMVNLEDRLEKIKRLLVDRGKYFTITRGRQYGKTTTLQALKHYLETDYLVLFTDFQMLSSTSFKEEASFSKAFAEILEKAFQTTGTKYFKSCPIQEKSVSALSDCTSLRTLFKQISYICKILPVPVVLMIDEADSASDNQIFTDFLSMLREYYLDRENSPTFHSVILAGVYDIKNLKLKLRPEANHHYNSPWNIAAKFNIDMNFSANQIAGMLLEYESDHHTQMNVQMIADEIYSYTSGYPYFVSAVCKILDEELPEINAFPNEHSVWSHQGIAYAINFLLKEDISLFGNMAKQLDSYEDLRKMIECILYEGRKIAFSPLDRSVSLGTMFGFLKNENGYTVVANRIFEMALLTMFSTKESVNSDTWHYGQREKNQFLSNGRLNMDLILQKFTEHFTDIYGDNDEKFIEKYGRKFFLLYLKPIINGAGNYYLEAQTRDAGRTDVIIDYLGCQYIVEMKIWHGNEYNKRGELQLLEYLNYFHLQKGYLLSFNFNKSKETGIKTIRLNDRIIIEAVV